MTWIDLNEKNDLAHVIERSFELPVLIFKHSTRCSISDMAMTRLERSWESQMQGKVETYYLDLLSYRAISNQIAQTFNVQHESPQVLLIYQGKCLYHASHTAIQYNQIKQKITELEATA